MNVDGGGGRERGVFGLYRRVAGEGGIRRRFYRHVSAMFRSPSPVLVADFSALCEIEHIMAREIFSFYN